MIYKADFEVEIPDDYMNRALDDKEITSILFQAFGEHYVKTMFAPDKIFDF